MTDQTTTSTVSTLVDHVAVTDTVVARLAQNPQIQFHHTHGGTSGVPRYIADEIGQAVLALVPDTLGELTPEQYALLDALRDVAQTADAPGAKYAVEQLARLAGEVFGHPMPAPRVGALVIPPMSFLVGEAGPEPLTVTDRKPWPFKPGTIVRDEDGAETEWLDAAPVGVVVSVGDVGDLWARTAGPMIEWHSLTGGTHHTSATIASLGMVRVVSVPAQLEACTDGAPAGDA